MLADLYDPNECSATIATKVHKAVYEILQDNDPYRVLKQTSNTVAQSLVPKVETLIKNSEDPLRTSMLCAIIGNIMDFGIDGSSAHPRMLEEVFDTLYTEGFGYDEYPKLRKMIASARHLMFFADNCGEIVFDKILCRELKRFNNSLSITLVAKGEPVLSDATQNDVEALRFHEVVDAIQTTGCFAVGVNFKKLPREVTTALAQADLILCKGMANYESFSETTYKPVAYLVRTKCKTIADSMKLPLNISAIKIYE
jgi:uncharacterized protein with ATP-grasp and redox domains